MIFGNVAFPSTNPAALVTTTQTLDGWVEDYQDPSTYLDPFQCETGFHLKIFGLDAKGRPKSSLRVFQNRYPIHQLLKEAGC